MSLKTFLSQDPKNWYAGRKLGDNPGAFRNSVCKDPEAGKVLDPFEKLTEGKHDWNVVQQGGFIVYVYQ